MYRWSFDYHEDEYVKDGSLCSILASTTSACTVGEGVYIDVSEIVMVVGESGSLSLGEKRNRQLKVW